MKARMSKFVCIEFIIALMFIAVGLGYFACMMANLLNDEKLPLNV